MELENCQNKIKSNNVELDNTDDTNNNNNNKRPINFEDALTLTKFGKFNIILILISGVNLTAVLLETLGISFVLPVAQCDLQLSTQDKGILSAIAFAGIITSSHLWGFLADTKGRRYVILPTLFIAFTCTVLSSFITNFWIFTILRYLNGFFISGSSATIYAYLGEFHNMKNRSRAIMGASFIFGIGCMLLPGIAWLVINQEWEYDMKFINLVYKPWRLFLVVCGIPSLLCAMVIYKFPESPKFVLSQGNQQDTIDILETMYKVNTGNNKKSLNITSIIEEQESIKMQKQRDEKANQGGFSILKTMYAQTAPLFMKPHLSKTLIACTIQFGIFATSNGMYMWFPDIINRFVEFIDKNPDNPITICDVVYMKKAIVTNTTTNMLQDCNEKLDISTYKHSLILEIFYAVGFAVIGLVINAIGKLPILCVVLVGCGACGVASVFINIPLLAIYLYCVLLLCGLAVTVVNAATVDLYPTHLRAMAVCISLMMGRLGSVVGANVVGILIDSSCPATFMLSGFSLIGCAILSIFIPNIYRRPTEQRQSTESISQ